MIDLSDLLAPEAVVADLAATGKKPLLAALGQAVHRVYGVPARAVTDRLAERERLGTTGFGGGIAIPHARIAGIDGVRGLFARLAQPVDFDAIDELPVDLAFVLLSPADAGAEHLKALSRVSRALRDRAFIAKLRGAGSSDALYALLTGVDARDAA